MSYNEAPEEYEIPPEVYRPLVCGTRRTAKRAHNDYRVLCATCGAGGSYRYRTHEEAAHAAVSNSARMCRACGAH